SGTAQSESVQVGGECDPPHWVSWECSFLALIDPQEPWYRYAGFRAPDGAFEVAAEFNSFFWDWNSVLDGTGTLNLRIDSGGGFCTILDRIPPSPPIGSVPLVFTLARPDFSHEGAG